MLFGQVLLPHRSNCKKSSVERHRWLSAWLQPVSWTYIHTTGAARPVVARRLSASDSPGHEDRSKNHARPNWRASLYTLVGKLSTFARMTTMLADRRHDLQNSFRKVLTLGIVLRSEKISNVLVLNQLSILYST